MKDINEKIDQLDNKELLNKIKKDTTKRTTFNLLKFANESLGNLSKVHNLKHKEIFKVGCENKSILEIATQIATERSDIDKKQETIQRTILVNDSSINTLKKISKENKIKRDVLVSYLIFTVYSLLEKTKKEERTKFEKGEKIVSNVESYLLEQEIILKNTLGEDHPVVRDFGYVINTCMNLSTKIFDHLYDNKPYDENIF